MSEKQVVPDNSISAIASRVPSLTKSASTNAASSGQMRSFSHVCRGRSSAAPRSRVMAAWPWAFTSPGSNACPGRSRRVAAGSAYSSAREPMAAIRPLRMPTAASASTCRSGSAHTSQSAPMTRSKGVSDMGAVYRRAVASRARARLHRVSIVRRPRVGSGPGRRVKMGGFVRADSYTLRTSQFRRQFRRHFRCHMRQLAHMRAADE